MIFEQYLRELPDKALSLGVRVILALIIFAIGIKIIAVMRKFVKKALDRSHASTEVVQYLDSAVKVFLYVLLVFQILLQLGIEAASIASVVASAGVTIGLAIQGSLSNCIGGILILVLKPFKVGDYIIEDTYKNEGEVKEISIFYTRLATPDNKTILLPNGNLANSSLTNVTSAPERRLDINIGISYQADIKKAKEVALSHMQKQPMILQDKDMGVYVNALGESSVELILRCWTKKEDYWIVRWWLLEEIKTAFDEEGISIPYNQLDVHIVS